ncbi:hypothetical protein L1987_34637 [Smallanthus sonchifolius]|uniref:Uncharacterized protein n=1 Tax=Smallanthus sonchifolius TaxID=185202 RepID=A0ACB9HTT6_9ASTR|nr:hypothetical protein L1987_34637 [Smallanthus sonchifolius]
MSNIGNYFSLKFMAKPGDRTDDAQSINEPSKSNNDQHIAPEEDADNGCQTPTSDDHKILPPRFHLPPPPPPHKLLQKRRRRSSDDGTTIEFFETTRREEVDAFFRLFTLRVSSSSSSRKRRSHSI